MTRVRQRSTWWRRIARRLARELFRLAENNEDTRFSRNGERWFLGQTLRDQCPDPAAPAIIIDAGANVGGYTREVLQLAQEVNRRVEVHAFEPSPHCVGILRREFAGRADVHVAPTALADEAGESLLHANEEGSSLASLVLRPRFAGQRDCVARVPLMRLDAYLEQRSIARVDLLKLDVEGFELAALRGAGERLTPRSIDAIQFEYGGTTMDAGTTLRDLFGLLRDRGYIVAKLLPRELEVRAYAPWMENYAYANYVALSPRWLERAAART